jgi:hypothetical protein
MIFSGSNPIGFRAKKDSDCQGDQMPLKFTMHHAAEKRQRCFYLKLYSKNAAKNSIWLPFHPLP